MSVLTSVFERDISRNERGLVHCYDDGPGAQWRVGRLLVTVGRPFGAVGRLSWVSRPTVGIVGRRTKVRRPTDDPMRM